MKCKPLPTQEELHRLFNYYPETGIVTWRYSKYKSLINKRAGSNTKRGYRNINYNKQHYREHRIIWVWMSGFDPCDLEVDHVNRIPDDNRWINLRLASRSQNVANSDIRSTNKSGYRGVYYNKKKRKYDARIIYNNQLIFLGNFDDPKEAYSNYRKKSKELYGDYSNAM